MCLGKECYFEKIRRPPICSPLPSHLQTLFRYIPKAANSGSFFHFPSEAGGFGHITVVCKSRSPMLRSATWKPGTKQNLRAVLKHSDFYDTLKFGRLLSILLHENIFFKHTWSSFSVPSTPYVSTRISIIKWEKKVQIGVLKYTCRKSVKTDLWSWRHFVFKERVSQGEGNGHQWQWQRSTPSKLDVCEFKPPGSQGLLGTSWINYFFFFQLILKKISL